MSEEKQPTRSEILDSLRANRARLLRTVEALSEEDLLVPWCGAWSVKDILAHIIGWESMTVKRLELLDQGRGAEMPFFQMAEIDARNAAVTEAHRSKSREEVIAEMRDARDRLEGILKGLSDDALAFEGPRGPVPRWLPHSTYEHEAKHCADIERWMESRKTTPGNI